MKAREAHHKAILTDAEEVEASDKLVVMPGEKQSSFSRTKRWLTRTNGRDVPIVDPGEITFKIQLKTTCDRSLRSRVEPLEIDSQPQRSRFQMKFRRAVRSRIGRQQWQRKIIAPR